MRAADLFLLLPLLVLVAVPSVLGDFGAYQMGLFLMYGIVGQGIALCWGRIGILPLGQALFFGLGAYLGGGALIKWETSPALLYPALLGAVLIPAALAGAIGLLVFRKQSGSGPYFSLITLALSMLAFQFALSADSITGGFNGLTGVPPLPGTDPWGNHYWVILAAVAISSVALLTLYRAPMGVVLSAISQNEQRMAFLGYDTTALKSLGFAVSAALAGFAGLLFASHQGIVTPQSLGYLLSGELLIWTAVGGRASLLGPLVGAILIGFLSSELRGQFALWEVLIAAIFLAVVLFAPNGLAGLLAPLTRRFTRRPPPDRTRVLPVRDISPDPQLTFQNAHVVMGPVRILQGLDLEVPSKGLHCVIGPNGAGKTSAFNALTGQLPVSQGRITWAGRDITGLAAHKVARLGIARKLQVPAIFADMTIGAHIDIALWSGSFGWRSFFASSAYGARNAILDTLQEMFPFLVEEDKRAGDLSLGHRQVLEFALSVLAQPQLILLDEPCAGLSTQETAQLTDAIQKVATKFDISALLIEHDFGVVEALSDHIFVLHQGRKLAEGSLQTIRDNPDVQNVYAGDRK